MPLEREEIRRALLKKGFVEQGGDHEYYRFLRNDKLYPIGTKLSRGSKYKVYDDSLLGQVSRQLGLTLPELREFISCAFGADEYYSKLCERGRIRD